MAMRHHSNARKRPPFLALSCFRGFPVADSDVGHSAASQRKPPWFSLSKKKTVPADTPATELTPEATRRDGDWRKSGDGRDGEGNRPGLRRPRRRAQSRVPALAAAVVPGDPAGSFLKPQKGQRKNACTGSPTKDVGSSLRHRLQLQQPCLPSVNPEYNAGRTQLAPLPPRRPARAAPGCSYSPRTMVALTTDAAGIGCPRGTRPHDGCEESSFVGGHDQVGGLSVLVLVLLLLLMLFGRTSSTAVICTCACLCFLPRLRDAAGDTTGRGRSSSDGGEVDFDSKEYKKKVILDGLLERSGRRPASSP